MNTYVAPRVLPPSPNRREWERVCLLYRPLPRSLVLSVVVALATAVSMWDDWLQDEILYWGGLMAVACLARFCLLIAFIRAKAKENPAPLLWENLFAAGSALMGLAWGALALLGPVPREYTVYIVFVLGGLSMGSAGLQGASWRSFAAFNIPLIVAQASALFVLGGRFHYVMGLMALLFTVGLITAFIEFRQALLTSLDSNRENEKLHHQQRLIFETVTTGVAYTRERHIVDCNQQLADMLGYLREEVIGCSTRFYYENHEVWEQVGADGFEAMRAGQTYRGEIQLRTKAGDLITCDLAMESVLPRQPEHGVVVVASDITARKQQEKQLRTALLQQTAIFEGAPAAIFLSRHRNIEDCNETAVKMFGHTREEWLGHTPRRLFASNEEYLWRGKETLDALTRGETYNYEHELVHKDGSRVWCRVRGTLLDPTNLEDGTAVYVLVDITASKRAEEALRQSREHLAQVLRASQSGIWDYDMVTGQAAFSARFLEILGFPATADPGEVLPIGRRIEKADRPRVFAAYREHLLANAPFNVDFRLRRRDATPVWVRGYAQASWDENGKPTRFVGSLLDISDNKRQEAEIERMALHDALTGLPNRRLLEDRLRFALASSKRRQTKVVVMLIDLDGFKAVNDHFGHAAGDLVLQEVAARLEGALRESDTVSRIGGDEFVVVLEGNLAGEDIATVAEKIMSRLKTPIIAGDYSFHIGCSIGIACSPGDGEAPEALIRLADKAMYSVKRTGRNGYALYSDIGETPGQEDGCAPVPSPVFLRT